MRPHTFAHPHQNRLVLWKAVQGSAEGTMFQNQAVPGLVCALL